MSVRQDIVHNIFDDLWSEVSPYLKPLISKITNEFISPNNDGEVGTEISIDIQDTVNEDGEDEDGLTYLCSAMTIRPIPLQKRESSARTRS